MNQFEYLTPEALRRLEHAREPLLDDNGEPVTIMGIAVYTDELLPPGTWKLVNQPETIVR
jgi:hypothetical protein